jgi:hypothetical protein
MFSFQLAFLFFASDTAVFMEYRREYFCAEHREIHQGPELFRGEIDTPLKINNFLFQKNLLDSYHPRRISLHEWSALKWLKSGFVTLRCEGWKSV